MCFFFANTIFFYNFVAEKDIKQPFLIILVMKKLFFVVMAVAAMSFASCGNKSANQSEAPADSTAVETVDVSDVTAALAAGLTEGDASKLQATLETVKEKVAQLLQENPEQAKEYLTQVQDFLKENAEKVKEVVGDNAVVQTVVSSLVETPAETIVTALQSQLVATDEAGQAVVDNAVEQANVTVDAVKNAVKEQLNATKQAAQDQADAAQQAAQQKVEEGKQQARDAVNGAAQKTNEKVNEAANKALKGLGL